MEFTICVICFTIIAVVAIGTRFIVSVHRIDCDTKKTNSDLQHQIDELKRELGELKQK
jgi:cell division protein FtsL